MWFSRKQVEKVSPGVVQPNTKTTTKKRGDAAEALALAYLFDVGLKLIERNYRTSGRGGGEIDLIMRDKDGTLVFIEVRQRSSQSHGGAGASIGATKQRRIIFAARYYLMRLASAPPCRFDVVLVQGGSDAVQAASIEWLRSAFDAS
jgi:putative endonuclease